MAKKTSSTWDKVKYPLYAGGSYVGGSYGLDILSKLLGLKDGGRVRGVGKAKRGFGRAMRKK
tara:strand:- start:176 stop:361 length:186 start_codon:yes stop_codon:yes gene_type:complete